MTAGIMLSMCTVLKAATIIMWLHGSVVIASENRDKFSAERKAPVKFGKLCLTGFRIDDDNISIAININGLDSAKWHMHHSNYILQDQR